MSVWSSLALHVGIFGALALGMAALAALRAIAEHALGALGRERAIGAERSPPGRG